MSSAQRGIHPLDEDGLETEAAPFALKEQVVERLAAHRARRTQHSPKQVTPIAPSTPARERSARIAAAVAERYAQSQSYRSFLAAEAERAIRQAEAAAEVAVLNAQAVANAQYQLLAELDQWSLTPPPAPQPEPPATESLASSASEAVTAPPIAPAPVLTVRLYEDVSRNSPEPTPSAHRLESQILLDEAEGLALDEEIAFRQSPVFELIDPPTDIPANLIEFPRQLIAARKARPRLAEGPLREDADQATPTAQLRIFEVEAAQISTAPAVETIEPVWSSIMLSALPAPAPVESTEPVFNPALPPQTAPISLRLMAGIVDACILVASLLAFTAVSAITFEEFASRHAAAIAPPMNLQTAAISGIAIFCILTALYHLLFFTFSEATPGMRYARIGLCTFSDDNPTRSAMRRRLFAMLLAACPLGIGFLWALLDDDKLGWHDRISRMYQRSY
jgi:uncharacterized RDD family membrane protein YckC